MKTGGLNFDVFNDLKKIISFYDRNRQIAIFKNIINKRRCYQNIAIFTKINT